MFRVTPTLPKFTGEVFWKKNIILCILKGKMPFKMHKIIYLSQKKIIKKICVSTLPKIFRPLTRNTLIILFGLKMRNSLFSEKVQDRNRG